MEGAVGAPRTGPTTSSHAHHAPIIPSHALTMPLHNQAMLQPCSCIPNHP